MASALVITNETDADVSTITEVTVAALAKISGATGLGCCGEAQYGQKPKNGSIMPTASCSSKAVIPEKLNRPHSIASLPIP